MSLVIVCEFSLLLEIIYAIIDLSYNKIKKLMLNLLNI